MPNAGWRASPVRTACIILVAAGGAWGLHAGWAAYQARRTPSCAWPLRVRGQATAAQAGLVRCYLKALAEGDIQGLLAVAQNNPPAHITTAGLGYSADARAGQATATFTPSPVDSTYVLLTIRYANGARENTGLLKMVAMGGSPVWRMSIGS
ncbi:MAG: hypothetical protein ACLPKI_11020 [Streptosporangiaceae bacterium]